MHERLTFYQTFNARGAKAIIAVLDPLILTLQTSGQVALTTEDFARFHAQITECEEELAKCASIFMSCAWKTSESYPPMFWSSELKRLFRQRRGNICLNLSAAK